MMTMIITMTVSRLQAANEHGGSRAYDHYHIGTLAGTGQLNLKKNKQALYR